MIEKTVKIALLALILLFSYLVYQSIAGKIAFDEDAKLRRDKVIERLKDIRSAQLAYKEVKREFANNFNDLLNFIKNDSLPVIKAIGTVPDTLTEEQAVRMGLVRRDTIFISAKDSVFSPSSIKSHRFPFNLDSLSYIPYSGGDQFKIESGEIEKGKVKVKVFEIFASFGQIYSGLDTHNESIDMEEGLRMGSMTEASVSGNWGE